MIESIQDLRCVHRHTFEEHPSCFVNGLFSKESKKLIKELDMPWYQLPGMRIGYIDIEVTGGLNAEFSDMICWAIKEKDGDTTYDIITPAEITRFGGEKRIISTLIKEMRKYQVLVGYYSGDYHFDIPLIRTKCIHYGFEFPSYGEQYHFDLYATVKAKLKLRNNRLATVCEYFGIEGKTPLDIETWKRVRYGEKKALDYVLEHNLGDVEITEQLHNKIEPFAKWSKKSI